MPITEKQTVCVNSGFAHPADTTKQVQFDMSGITSNSPAVVTIPNASGTMALQGPAFMAQITSAQTLAHNTEQKLTFNSEQFDTHGVYDPTTNYRFTPGVAGIYQVNIMLMMSGVTSSKYYDLDLRLKKTGSVVKTSWNGGYVNSSTYANVTMSCLVSMSASDYLEAFVYWYDYTSSASAPTGSGTQTEFSACLLNRT